eukprot:TRINITY_DN46903_c1_g1_i3.p1 TRINITY_DN46903_c1_g1~~TRINITY_DN46903_c1_g1_i3.p1  ORF type:complete len:219 (-),score=-46.20 TRINITY_DN46903_c1_g1_i3:117-773(-)
MDVNYIVDGNGNKTHVIVKIEDWNLIKENSSNSSINKIEQFSSDKKINLIMSSYNLFMDMVADFDVTDWQVHFKNVFKYMNYIEAKDFGLLYLLRNDTFQYILRKENLLEISQELYENYKVRTLDDKILSENDIKALKDILFNSASSDSLIKEFNRFYKIGDKVNIKFRKDAEIKRLFIYDTLRIIPKFFKTFVSMIEPKEKEEIEKVFSDTSDIESA